MADLGHAHHLKEQVEAMKKEAEHQHNVKEKHVSVSGVRAHNQGASA
jgi:hypothetical protein